MPLTPLTFEDEQPTLAPLDFGGPTNAQQLPSLDFGDSPALPPLDFSTPLQPLEFEDAPPIVEPFSKEGLTYTLGRPLAALETSGFALTEGIARMGEYREKIANKILGQPDKENLFGRMADIYSQPEVYGLVTPTVRGIGAKIQQRYDYEAEQGRKIGPIDASQFGKVTDQIAGVGELLTQWGLMGAIGKGQQVGQMLSAAPVKAQQALAAMKQVGRVGTHRFLTSTGDWKQRAQNALTGMAYNMTPHIVGAEGFVGARAVMADILHNMFISSPTYAQAIKEKASTGEMAKDTVTNVLMAFGTDVAFSLGTRGLAEGQYKARLDKYWENRIKPFDVSKEEHRSIMGNIRKHIKGLDVEKEQNQWPVIGSLDTMPIKLADIHNKEGGFTYNRKGESLTGKEGFSVSDHQDREQIIPGAKVTPAQMKEFIDANKDLLAQGASIGSWYDKAGNKTYLDIVTTPKDIGEAQRLGRLNGQKAIYDLKAGKEIAVDYKVKDLYHYSDIDITKTDVNKFGQNSYTERDTIASDVPRTFFYGEPKAYEKWFQGPAAKLTHGTVETSKLYDLTKDSLGLKKKHLNDSREITKAISEKYEGVIYKPTGEHDVIALFKNIPVKSIGAHGVDVAGKHGEAYRDYTQGQAHMLDVLKGKGWSDEKILKYMTMMHAEGAKHLGEIYAKSKAQGYTDAEIVDEISRDYQLLMEKEVLDGKTSTLNDLVNKYLVDETGGIKLDGEALKDFNSAIDTIASAFTRYRGIDDPTRAVFVKVEETEGIRKEEAAKIAVSMFGPEAGLTREQAEKLFRHMENPTKVSKDGIPNVDEHIKSYKGLIGRFNLEAKRSGITIPDYLAGRKKGLQDTIKRLEGEIKDLKHLKAIKHRKDLLYETRRTLKKVEGLEYVHRVTYRTTGSKIKETLRPWTKNVSAKPQHFFGRKYDTIDDARKAGLEIGSLAESASEVIYETGSMALKSQLIKAINSNPNYAVKANSDIGNAKLLEGWEKIQSSLFPKAEGRLYHPAMVDALRDFTYTNSATKWDILSRPYDSLNHVLKFITFYNPPVMWKNDIAQGWRGAGIKFFTNMPKAFKIWHEKGDLYHELTEGGIFNKIMDYKPAVSAIARDMIDQAERNHGQKFARDLSFMLRHPVNALQIANNKVTWSGDEVMRIATYLGIKNADATKGMSQFQKIDLANDFMAAYNKLPRGSKVVLNRAFFVPTYKISMARILGKMYRHPGQFKSQLVRHNLYKQFVRYALPMIASSIAINWFGENPEEVESWVEKGYRLVVKIGGKEKVYTLSDPLLEEAKVVHRKPQQTLAVNMSAALQFVYALLKRNGGSLTESDNRRLHEFFKVGAPVIRDIDNWRNKDKTNAEKFVQQFSLAYVYSRKPAKRDEDERPALVKALSAVDLWLDWAPKSRDRELQQIETQYKYFSDGIANAIINNNYKEVHRLQADARKILGAPIPAKNIQSKVRSKRKGLQPTLTRHEQQVKRKNKFIQHVYNKRRK